MTTNWIEKRVSPLPECNDSELNRKLNSIVDYFEQDWLELEGKNPIQLLWKRKDLQATTELLLFGDALEKLTSIDANWIKRRVKNIKSRKTRIGDVFEIVGLAMLQNTNQLVHPARDNQPGFDGTVEVNGGPKWYVSMKNFGVSSHEEAFRKWAEEVNEKFKKFLQANGWNGLLLNIIAREFPDECRKTDFLKNFDHNILRNIVAAQQNAISDGFWTLRILEVSYADELANSLTSCQVAVVWPFHRNEKINLISQISSACSNFTKHVPRYNDTNYLRCLFLRFSATASLAACQNWSKEYFDENLSSEIDMIAGYQTSVITTQPGEEHQIAHCTFCVPRPGLFSSGYSRAQINLKLDVLIGQIVNPSISTTFGEGTIKLKDYYVFQKGDIYCRPKINASGELSGEMKHLADGVRIHSLIESSGGYLVLSGNYPESHQLLLFS